MRVTTVISLLLVLAGCQARSQRIVIGSKNFTEQIILGELLAQQIENRTGLAVERRLDLGGTLLCHKAIVSGEIDAYVEYTGTALTAILKQTPSGSAQDIYRRVKEAYSKQFDLEVGPQLGFNNTFAIVIRGEDARRLHLTTLSDAAREAPHWTAGFGYEFMERPDGYKGLAATYGLRFAGPPRIMDLGLIYRALKEHQVDLVAGNSTDGMIAALDLVVLQDDRRYFPPYDAVPVVRRQTLERHPNLRDCLRELAGKISEEDMRRLNYQVDGEHRDVTLVVREFLRAKGFIPPP